MRAAYYIRRGAAAEVLHVGDLPLPQPGPGEQDVDLALVALNGVIAAYSSDAIQTPPLRFLGFLARDVTLRMALIYEAPRVAREAAVRDITHLLETGRLKHQVTVRFPLQQIVQAHEAMESGRVVGKILVDIE